MCCIKNNNDKLINCRKPSTWKENVPDSVKCTFTGDVCAFNLPIIHFRLQTDSTWQRQPGCIHLVDWLESTFICTLLTAGKTAWTSRWVGCSMQLNPSSPLFHLTLCGLGYNWTFLTTLGFTFIFHLKNSLPCLVWCHCFQHNLTCGKQVIFFHFDILY